MGLALWILMGFLSWALVAVVRPLVKTPAFRGPLRLALAVAGFRAAMEIASPSVLPRLYIHRALVLIFFLAGRAGSQWILLPNAGVHVSIPGCRR